MTELNAAIDPINGNSAGLLIEDLNDLRRPCWIPYPRAEQGFQKLLDLLRSPPSHRPGGMLLYGDSNSGKTTLTRYFQAHMAKVGKVGDADFSFRGPNYILTVQCPPYSSTGALLSGTLRTLKAPHQDSWHWEKKLGATVSILSKTNVRMVIIDEIHNALTGSHDKRVHFLNTIKYLSNELCVPVVAVGTSLALTTIQTDQQLGSRLEPFKLPKWDADKEFAQFLGRIFLHLKVKPVPAVNSRKFRERFVHMTDGLTGEVWSLALKVAEGMHAKGQEIVDEDIVVETPWVRPQDRRSER
ncbi:TniB family NTP-binding protein [Ferrovibrio xuzhouensis]|uniref:TniB family NTP-binding protein n=1 Tax=Ferrovibrio xuzhouensis TaxID=1576914 RepID=A0ABV7VFH5_9PROT